MMKAAKTILVADAVLAVLFIACELPGVTGVPAHEWLGIVLAVALLAHAGKRVITTVKNARNAARLVVDVVMLVTLAVCVVSGLIISGSVLPFFGYYATGYYFWSPLHAATATVLLAVLLVHAALNAGRVKSFLSTDDKSEKPSRALANNTENNDNEQGKYAEENRGEGGARE